MPSPLQKKAESDFVNYSIKNLGKFCRCHFKETSGFQKKAFGVIDARTFPDKTLLFVRWERYEPKDAAILRVVWGESRIEDESILDKCDLASQDMALVRQLKGQATEADEMLLHQHKDNAISGHYDVLEVHQDVQDEATAETKEDDPRSNPSGPDVTFCIAASSSTAAGESPPPSPDTPIESPDPSSAVVDQRGQNQDSPEQSEQYPRWLKRWMTIRIPVKTAMRDINLIQNHPITDLLKIRDLFDERGVLTY